MERLLNIDRRFIYLAVAVVMVIGLAVGIRVPLPTTVGAKRTFAAVEAVPVGSAIIVAMDYPPASAPELEPMSRAALRHAFARDLRVLAVSFEADGVPGAQDLLQKAAAASGKVEGEDYVFLGFRPDITAALVGMVDSIPSVFPDVEVGGEMTPIVDVPALAGIVGLGDVALAIEMTGGKKYENWIDYANARADLPLCSGATGAIVTGLYPYLATGQLVGLLRSTRGASDYEALVRDAYGGLEADASKTMGVLLLGHLLLLGLIGVANVAFLVSKRSAGEVV